MTRIEHLNITVPDIDEAIKFIQIVAPDFQVRKDETPPESYRWVHIGNDDYYFALQAPHIGASPETARTTYKNYGVNHIALMVDNISSIETTLINAGYKRSIETPNETHRQRLYFYDKAGFEWELVEYSSELVKEKYLYE
jgi:catechol 2,3-dioxygenase-like lactoylglutathione lyase family enzyme